MSKRRKSVKSVDRPKKVALPDAVSDNEDGDVIGSNLHGDEIDDFYDQEENALSIKLSGRSKGPRNLEDVNEVFGLSDSDDDFIDGHKKKNKRTKELPEGDEFDAEETTGTWGGKKKNFYGGNPNERPAHKKPGNEKEKDNDENELNEAEAEEKESRFLQEKQLQNLTDEDFLFDVYGATTTVGKKKKAASTDVDNDLENVKLDLSKLSRREKVRLFERECPEFSLIVNEFDVRMREIASTYQPLVDLMSQGTLPCEGPAAEYIKMKHMLAINYGVNIACYLMFKSRKVDLKMHPLTARLVGYKNILDEMEKKLDPIVLPQIQAILDLISRDGGLQKLKKMVAKAKQPDPVKKAVAKKPKKTLKILKNSTAVGETAEESTAHLNEFTPDEAMAIQLMGGRKKKLKKQDSDVEESEAEQDDLKHDEGAEDDEEARRSITYEMSKNKGLMPKRSKLQRNPRVKHRVKYEKAKVRRKGQIREVRTEVKKYAGEMSGINKRVKKGIKLA